MKKDWRELTERSTPLMLRLLVLACSYLPRALVRLALYPIVAYFLATGGAARTASRNYLRRVLKREPTLLDMWRHFFTFASCTLDRIFMLSANPGGIVVDVAWTHGVAPLEFGKSGCLFVVAHFGSGEVLRFMPAQPQVAAPLQQDEHGVRAFQPIRTDVNGIDMSILMDKQHGRMLMELLERLHPTLKLQVIDAAERGPQLALKLKEALEAGRMVCVMADRVAAGEGAVTVDFIDGKVRMAETPWILANALKVPVILGFGMYRGGNRYTCRIELFAEQVTLPRGNRAAALAEYAQRYANRLEHYVSEAPYNWFNFYDYWLSEPNADEAASH